MVSYCFINIVVVSDITSLIVNTGHKTSCGGGFVLFRVPYREAATTNIHGRDVIRLPLAVNKSVCLPLNNHGLVEMLGVQQED